MGGIVLGIALLGGAAAHAVVVLQTYSGTVTSGNDHAGLFGPPLADLTGKPFVAVFKVDSARGSLSTSSVVVPEPESVAQLISGLACIGSFAMLRRSAARTRSPSR